MRISPSKSLASVVIALTLFISVAEFGPSVLSGQEMNLPDHNRAPEFVGISRWLNSPPLTAAALEGKVVLVQFWTYFCINWLHTLPYVTKWYEKYKDKGFVVIGIHAPEFAFEKETSNLEAAILRFGITYPVAQDNQFSTWGAYKNRYWPAEYLIDRSGKVVTAHFGEGNYQRMESAIAGLLGERLPDTKAGDPDLSQIWSPEMYFGSEKNSNAVEISQSSRVGARSYVLPREVMLDRFAFGGSWRLSEDRATLLADGGEILIRFRSPKVNLVAGSLSSQQLSITVDGKPQPSVAVQGSQLYSLYNGTSGNHLLRLMITKTGLSAYTFTFG